MIIPCIDLLGGKVVQLIQGREKALEVDSVDEMLEKFAPFPQIQVIDLDAAMGTGLANEGLIVQIAARAKARIGGGVRTVDHAEFLLNRGAYRVIVGTSAFSGNGVNRPFLEQLCERVDPRRVLIALDSKGGHIVVKGWKESIDLTAEEVIQQMEPYCGGFLCTYVDKEGMLQGTDLDWFRRLRAATSHEITAAGGITTLDDVRALTAMRIDCALGMAIYTGRLKLDDLAALNVSAGTP